MRIEFIAFVLVGLAPELLTMSSALSFLSGSHYVVLVGDVGSGKSTILEKLTGARNKSSNSFESFTRASEGLYTPDRSLIVADTPGSNAMRDKMEHNVWIARALNFQPVSRYHRARKRDETVD